MKIGIDVSMLVYRGSGVATYTYQLVRALLSNHPEHKYRLFYSSFRKPGDVLEKLDEFRSLGATVYAYSLPPWVLQFLWNRKHWLPVEWLIGRVNAYHSSDFLRPPLLSGTQGITTIHDLTWKLYPEYHTDEIVAGHERKLHQTIARKDMIVVDSQQTKNDLLHFYPEIDIELVHVISLGVAEEFRRLPLSEQVRVRKVYGLPTQSPLLLYVGAIEPRKRLDLTIQAYGKLKKKRAYEAYHLVIAGRAGWKNERIFSLVDELQLTGKVHFPGYVAETDLPALYNAAEMLIYLSDYEGFGLPPLEAAACGIPFLVQKKSSLKELFRVDLEELFTDDISVERVSHKIEKILKNKDHYAHSLQALAKEFRWETTARDWLALL